MPLGLLKHRLPPIKLLAKWPIHDGLASPLVGSRWPLLFYI